MTDPLARPLWRGRTNVDRMTADAIEKAERIAGFAFNMTQGSYQSSVQQSAGTHDGGGAGDFSTRGLSLAQKGRMVTALRRVGFAAWLRTPAQGPWPEHIHAILGRHPRLSPSAARQWTSYVSGRNGLANNGADDGPRLVPIPTYEWTEDDMTPEDHQKIADTIRAIVADEIAKAGDTIKLDNPNGNGAKWSLSTVLRSTWNRASE